jgi:hypothetical protein
MSIPSSIDCDRAPMIFRLDNGTSQDVFWLLGCSTFGADRSATASENHPRRRREADVARMRCLLSAGLRPERMMFERPSFNLFRTVRNKLLGEGRLELIHKGGQA